MNDYGNCPICDEPILADDWPHTWTEDNLSDVHAECCIASGQCPVGVS